MIENFRLIKFSFMSLEEITSDASRIKMQIDPEIFLPYHNLKEKQQNIAVAQNHFINIGIAHRNLEQFRVHFPNLLILTNDRPDYADRGLEMDELILKKYKHKYIKGGYRDDYRFYRDAKNFNKDDIRNIIIDASSSLYSDFSEQFLYEGPEPINYRFMFSKSKIEIDIIVDIIENAKNEIEFIDNTLNYIDCIVYAVGHDIFCFETRNKALKEILMKRYRKLTNGPFSGL